MYVYTCIDLCRSVCAYMTCICLHVQYTCVCCVTKACSVHTRIYTHTHTHMHIHMHMHTHMHTHTHIHTYKHTYTHTHLHTHLVPIPTHRGADVRPFSSDGRTALHEAAQGGHHQVVELLVRKGADVMAMDDSDSTPYDMAFRNNHVQVG